MLNDFPYKIRTVFLDFVAEASEIKRRNKLTPTATSSRAHVLATYRELRDYSRGPAMPYNHGNQGDLVCQSWAFDVSVSGISAHSLPAIYVRVYYVRWKTHYQMCMSIITPKVGRLLWITYLTLIAH